MSLIKLNDFIKSIIMENIKPLTRREIPSLLDSFGLPFSKDDTGLSKAQYIENRLSLVNDDNVINIAERFLSLYGGYLFNKARFNLEELLWSATKSIIVLKSLRYKIAKELENIPIFLDGHAFIKFMKQLWDRNEFFDSIAFSDYGDIIKDIERHFIQNDDWSFHDLCKHIGAFDVSDKRFMLFLEGLASSDIRPDIESQRIFTDRVNFALSGSGIELREVDCEGGFPVYKFSSLSLCLGVPKNLIFASPRKPDIRFRDAVNNDIEIVNGLEDVLIFDKPFPSDGLRWRDLQNWWAEKHNLKDLEAKSQLYFRLLASMPKESPPQKLFFESYFRIFASNIPELPALLPEVWLHWDPKTVRERGPEALKSFRMDFLMLFSHEIRVVIEIDGKQHYSNPSGKADPLRYATMAKSDRELRLSGYDVYRFGATELDENSGPKHIQEFFSLLFKRYHVSFKFSDIMLL